MIAVICAPVLTLPMNATANGTLVSSDTISEVKVSLAFLPLATPISDAKVFTGRQMPLTQVAMLFAEITTKDGHMGLGFSYSKRAGGPGMYAHAREVGDGLLGEDPNDIARLWTKLVWAGASVGRSGLSTQANAAFDNALWDMKAKRAGLPLAKLLGCRRDGVSCYNTSGGFLSSPIEEVLNNVEKSIASGIGGIKIKDAVKDTAILFIPMLLVLFEQLYAFPIFYKIYLVKGFCLLLY